MNLLKLSAAFVLPIAATTVSTFALPAFAQLTSPDASSDPSAGLGTRDNSNVFSNDAGSGMGSVLDLIHQAQLGVGQSSEEFREGARRNLETDAEAFFRQQRERLQQQQQQQQQQPANTPATTAPATP